MQAEDCFYLGYITKTKGLKGEVQVFFESDTGGIKFKSVFIDIDNKLVPFFVSSYKLHPNQTGNFFFDDVDTIEKAQKLIRKKIYLPNSEKPAKSSRKISYSDFKGFTVYDKVHGELGEIAEVHEYPQQYVAMVPYRFREILFPLNDQIIQSIDQKRKILNISLPDGLIEIYLGQ
jgi:16S rRNA processing protein RimM